MFSPVNAQSFSQFTVRSENTPLTSSHSHSSLSAPASALSNLASLKRKPPSEFELESDESLKQARVKLSEELLNSRSPSPTSDSESTMEEFSYSGNQSPQLSEDSQGSSPLYLDPTIETFLPSRSQSPQTNESLSSNENGSEGGNGMEGVINTLNLLTPSIAEKQTLHTNEVTNLVNILGSLKMV